MPPRPLPTAPDSHSSPAPYQSPLKRFSAFTPKNDDSHRKQGNTSRSLQYSESMPVLDATAAYAVTSTAGIHLSPSTPKSLSNQSFESDLHSQMSSSSPPRNTMHRPTASEHSTYVDRESEQQKNFMNTPSRNSTVSVKNITAPKPTASPSAEPENTPSTSIEERPDYHIKIVCVGDGGCGKTCLMVTYTYGKFPTTYIPTVFENYLTNVRAPDGKLIELALWDTAGQEEYDRLRVLSYPEVNILLVCFAINSPPSLDNVVDKWIPEISHFCQDIPFLLVGLKSDLRAASPGEAKQPVISADQAKAVASKIGANRYMECSARLSHGISDVFNTAISIVLAEHLGLPPPPVIDDAPTATQKNPSKLPQKQKKPAKTEIVASSNSKKKKKKKSKCVIL